MFQIMIKLFAVTCVTFGFTYRVIHLCSVYDDMVEKSSEDKWYCSKCMHIDYECSQPSGSCSGSVADCLKCLCLNARSIFPKRLDLAAYLASLQYDIIAITESFWMTPLQIHLLYLHHMLDIVLTVTDMVEEYLF